MTRQKVSGRHGEELQRLDARRVRAIISQGNGRLVSLVRNLDQMVEDEGLRESVVDEAKRKLPGYFRNLDPEKRTQYLDNLGIDLFRAIVAYEQRQQLQNDGVSIRYRPFVQVRAGNSTQREIRIFNLPTPEEVGKFVRIEVHTDESPFGFEDCGNSAGRKPVYIADVPGRYMPEIYRAAFRQALIGMEARVDIAERVLGDYKTNSGDERRKVPRGRNVFEYKPKYETIVERDVEFLAARAEEGRENGKMMEFAVTQTGGTHSGVKFYLCTTSYPIVMLSTVPLDSEAANTSMGHYHRKNLEKREEEARREWQRREKNLVKLR